MLLRKLKDTIINNDKQEGFKNAITGYDMKNKLFPALGVLILISLFVLGACKGRDSEDSELNGPSEVYTGDSFEIRYCSKWHPQAQFSGIYMALEKGFYAQHGLDVKIQKVLQSDAALDSLESGALDVIHLDLLAALQVNADSFRVVNICQIAQRNPVLLVGKRSRGINSISDFAGKKIGVWRTGSNLSTYAFLEDHDLSMEIIPIDWSISLFTEDAVDVINIMCYNEYHQLLLSGIKEEDLFVVDLNALGYSVPDEGLYVTPEFYKAHPEECQNFASATIDGWFYAFSHIQETVSVVLERMRKANIKANKTLQHEMLNEMKKIVLPSTSEIGILKEEDYLRALELLYKMSELQIEMKYEDFYPHATE